MQGILYFQKEITAYVVYSLNWHAYPCLTYTFLDKGSFYWNQDNYIELFDLTRFC